MGKIIETKISNFAGGISDDLREPSAAGCGMVKHFDIFSNPNKLTPYRSTEADTATNVSSTDAEQYDIKDFQLGSDGKLYGLGKEATGYPKVLKKANPTTGNWLSSGGGNASTAEGEGNAARVSGAFIEWQSAFWFFQGTTQLAKCTLAGVITNAVATVGTITTVAQGIIGQDNNLYMFYNNKVVRVTPAGAATDNVLTAIPSDMRITSVAYYGSYLAIACAYGTSATASPTGRSQVFIWDMVTDTTVEDVVDWGDGALMILGNVEGRLVGVSNKYLETPSGLTSLAVGRGSMVVRMWAGGTPQVMKEVVGNQSVTLGRFIRNKVLKDNKIYWVASVPHHLSTSTESTYHVGIWCFGRKNRNSDFSLSLDFIEEAIDTSNFYINSFGNAGNYWFINHSTGGKVTKTDDTATYSFDSIYESQIFNGGEASKKKKLIGVTVDTVYLPADGTVTLKYRQDEETAWTQIFEESTDSSISHSAINIEKRTATMTIASPAVVTANFHGLAAGDAIYFTTSGALPTGVTANTTYYVISTGLAANTFQFSATSGGSAVNTSGTQSGTHTLYRRVANLPEYKEIQFRIESTGGAEITGLRFREELLDKDVY